MKSKAVKTMIIAVMILGVVVTQGWAQGRPGRGGMGPRGPQGRMRPGGRQGRDRDMQGPQRLLRQLDLTEEQQEKIKSIHEDNQEAMEAAREAVQKAMQALHEAVENEASEEDVHTAAAAVGQAMGEQALIRIKVQKAVKSELTEEQLKKWKELKEKVKERTEVFRDKEGDDFYGERPQRHHPGRHRR